MGDVAALQSVWYAAVRQRAASSPRSWQLEGMAPEDELNLSAPPDAPAPLGGRRTPLMLAARGGHTAAVTLLLMMGADASKRDADGRTTLDHASSGAVRALLLNAAPAVERQKLNTRLVAYAILDDAAGVEALLRAGAFTEAMHAGERSFGAGLFPLHFAARSGNVRMLRALLAHGADIEVQSFEGEFIRNVGGWREMRSPLDCAVHYGQHEASLVLLHAGADHSAYGGA